MPAHVSLTITIRSPGGACMDGFIIDRAWGDAK